jgi:hypothetical protein
MVSPQERARLMEKYKDQPIYAAGAFTKYLVCLLIVGGVAVIGARSDFIVNAEQGQAQQVSDRADIITAGVRCADQVPRVIAQQSANIGAPSGDSVDERQQQYVLTRTAIKTC